MENRGFSIIEMVIAILILSTGVLGMGATAEFMLSTASNAGIKAEALQAVEGRLSQISIDPRYTEMSTLYAGTETDMPGEGYERVTTISHTKTLLNGRYTDYKVVTVSVSGGGLPEAVSRSLTLAAP